MRSVIFIFITQKESFVYSASSQYPLSYLVSYNPILSYPISLYHISPHLISPYHISTYLTESYLISSLLSLYLLQPPSTSSTFHTKVQVLPQLEFSKEIGVFEVFPAAAFIDPGGLITVSTSSLFPFLSYILVSHYYAYFTHFALICLLY